MSTDQGMTRGADPGGHDSRYCGAPKKQSEGTCTRPAGWGTPHPGIGRCKLHLGSTPSHVAAAEAVLAKRYADAAIAGLWPGLVSAVPVRDPLDLLGRVAGALEEMTDRVGERVNSLKGVGGGEGLTQLRAEVVLLEKLLGHLRGVGSDMARLGIAERRVELEQGRAEIVVSAFLAAIEVLQLVPGDRSRVVGVFLERLGVGPGVLELEDSAGGEGS